MPKKKKSHQNEVPEIQAKKFEVYREEIEKEFSELSKTENPLLPKDAQFIWVLSSRHTVKFNHLNCAKESINYIASPLSGKNNNSKKKEEVACDVEDDFIRIKTAIEIAQKLTADRANKSIENLSRRDYQEHAPYIIYNGWSRQNVELQQVLSQIGSQGKPLPHYPLEKFIIFDLPHDNQNTVGQFLSLQEKIPKDKRLKRLKKLDEPLVILTSAYHAPRTRRIFGSPTHKFPLNNREGVTFYLLDRKFQRPCAQSDIKGEIDRILFYTNEKAWLGEPKKVNWQRPLESSISSTWTPWLQHTKSTKRTQSIVKEKSKPINLTEKETNNKKKRAKLS